jgi:RNA polymerase sigma factor (sigma-70 family)
MSDGAIRRLLGYVRRYADAGPASDAQLLARYVTDRDEAAFELLVWRHAGLVFGVCRRVLGDWHAAEDAFQATFLALARKARAIRRGESLAGWLHRVARRIASRARTSTIRRILVERRAAVGVNVKTGESGLADVREVVDEEVDRLPERLRRAVVLCYLEGLTTDEAARRVGCPRGTVLSRLAAARERLRGRLTKRGFGLPAAGLATVFVQTTAPAGLIAPAVRASLAYTAGTVAAAEVAPRVIGWADGVIRAMMLTKLKFAAGVVLAAGLRGGGAWVAGPGGGTGVALAEAPPQAEPPAVPQTDPRRPADQARQPILEQDREREQIERQRAEVLRRERLDETEKQIQRQEGEILEVEHNSLRSVIESRLRFMAAEDRLKQFERQRNDLLPALQRQLSDLMAREKALGVSLSPTHPEMVTIRAQLDMLRERIKDLEPGQLSYEKEVAKARREMVEAEIEYRFREREANLARARSQKRLDVLEDQWRSLARPRADMREPSPDLECKLDELLREVRELRREIKK